MPAMPLRQRHFALAVAALLSGLAGCSTVNDATHSFATSLTPYKVEVVQGNFVSKEQVDALQKGMTREQVRNILGTPLVVSLFHADRWDYAFTLRRKGVEPQRRDLTVYFKDELMDHVVGGENMPSEAEFVSTLDKRKMGKVPRLEATEAELNAFQAKNQSAAPVVPAPAPATPAPATTNYPPLESAPR